MKRDKITRLLKLALLSTMVSQLSIATADSHLDAEIPLIDLSKWKCKFCLAEEGWSGEVEPGIGYVSDDSFKFGEYSGLNEDGGFLIGNANLRYRGPDMKYFDLSASEVGLDSRSLDIEGGVQGKYNLFLQYDEIPHFISDTASTPYQGSGTDSLTLPAGWTTAGTTGGMTDLLTSLQNIDIETKRKQLGAGLSITPDSRWSYRVNVRHDTKEGSNRAAGSFFFNSTQLIEPVDYVTDEIETSASYTAAKWQANFSYNGSTFRNSNKSLTWDNAYTPIVAGADTGELALPPDNQFHQLIFSAAYEVSDLSRVSGDIAIGRMEQNEDFLAGTQNTTLIVSPLPANSANARVDTVNAKFRYLSVRGSKLRLTATYNYNERDNKTPQLTYDWVTTDAFLATARSNLPYSFTQNLLKLKADYKLAKGIRFGAGYDLNKNERTFQEVDKTTENTIWGSMRLRKIKNLFLELKLAHIDRDASNFQAVTAIDPPQNILLSKYNMADRVRNTLGLYANLTPESRYTLGLSLDISEDDYDKSILGLTDSQDISLNGDVSAMLSDDTSVNLYIGRERIESTQAGSQTFSTADWLATNEDTFTNIGVGVTHVAIKDKLDIGADYTKSRSTGTVTVSSGAPDPPFPEFSTNLDSWRLYANYHRNDKLSFRVAYWHESYDSTDWTLDGVSADTIPNVLGLAEQSPSYSTDVIKLSMSYKF